ncbi:MAG: hypothetical protein MR210_02565 [Erysipelotrichaceae bacterium]|nr:hypothetical protein [Erysipelotrichaceae bacterium]MDY5252599.1 hypothetical protein [Erysipelotrichaceae bacterium]
MYKIFNTNAITRQQRFNRALLCGSIASIVLGLAYGLFASMMRIEFSVVYLGIGYAIAKVILEYGRGVQVRFSVLAAVLCVISIFIGDIIAIFGFQSLFMPQLYGFIFFTYIRSLLAMNVSSLLGLLFRLGGVYIAYIYARVV